MSAFVLRKITSLVVVSGLTLSVAFGMAVSQAGATGAVTLPATRIVSFRLPTTAEAHHLYSNVYASGVVQYWNGASWQPLYAQWVQLFFRPKGATTWQHRNGIQTQSDGHFSILMPVELGTVDWQARVLKPDFVGGTTEGLPSTSVTITSTVKDRTWFESPGPLAERITRGSFAYGQLVDHHGAGSDGWSFAAVQGLQVKLYYRAKGTKSWRYYRTTRTGKDGTFQFRGLGKALGYDFRVVFPAQGVFMGVTSRTF